MFKTLSNEVNKKKFTRFVVIAIVSFMIAATSLVIVLNVDNVAANGSDRVALIFENNLSRQFHKSLYYDERNNEYFIIEYNYWNVVTLSGRNIIDYNTAAEYEKTYNTLYDITEKIKN